MNDRLCSKYENTFSPDTRDAQPCAFRNNRCLVSRLVQRIYEIGVRRLFSPVARPESMQKRTRENSNVLLHTIFLFHLPRLCKLIILTGRQDNVRVHIWVPVLR